MRALCEEAERDRQLEVPTISPEGREKRAEFRFDTLLHGGREMSGVGGVERSAADEDPGEIIEIQPGHRRGFEANPDEVAFGEACRGEKEPILLVGGHVFGAGREEDERLHTSR